MEKEEKGREGKWKHKGKQSGKQVKSLTSVFG